MDTFSPKPFCYPTFAWKLLSFAGELVFPETVKCVLCACDPQGRTQESKLSSSSPALPSLLFLGVLATQAQSADHGASAVGQKEHLARPVGKPIRLVAKAWHSHVANRKATTKPCMFCAFRLFLVSGFASLILTVLSAGKGPCCTLVSLPSYLTLFLTGARQDSRVDFV